MSAAPARSDWALVYEGFDPAHEPLREALCTLGNGYLATRGAGEEAHADEIHYPGTYLAGGYDRLESTVAGRVLTNEDLVNVPNWLVLSFQAAGGDWLNPLALELLAYRQTLDMRAGVLRRHLRLRDRHGRETLLESERIVHMRRPHLAALRWRLTPQNWSGPLTVHSALNGAVLNAGVARYRALDSKHLQVLAAAVRADSLDLAVRTRQSGLELAQVARTRVYRDGALHEVERRPVQRPEYVAQELLLRAREGETLTLEKIVALYSSRDRGISEPRLEAEKAVRRAGRFADLLEEHTSAWKHLWDRIDVGITSGEDLQRTVRLHIFHLFQSVSRHSIDLDVGVPARGLHGEAYRGHVFWDELFIFPFFTYRIPEITRALLLYRYRRLPEARHNAGQEGYRGAMYPWQSGSNGREETQVMHLNPRSGEWGPDYSRRQRHVNAAIAYNIWQYYWMSADLEFMEMYGAEMLLEIARFWASAAEYRSERGRYEIRGVMGPDEYHETLPGSDEPGLRNNAYTNVMAVWVLERALAVLDMLRPHARAELTELLRLDEAELRRWEEITGRMFVPFHEGEIISQFEGYERLAPFDWSAYRAKYGNIERLDRILKAEDDSADRYQVSKQADVLMLFYLLPPKELRRIFQKLGYTLSDETISRNIEYYLQRTSHGSTLSKVVHASVLDRLDRAAAYRMFCEALESDVSDVQGGTTPEGIHLGAMAGTVDIVLRHYAGIDTTEEVIAFHPRLPPDIERLHLRLRYRSSWYELTVTPELFSVELDGVAPATINVLGEHHQLFPAIRREFPLRG